MWLALAFVGWRQLVFVAVWCMRCGQHRLVGMVWSAWCDWCDVAGVM